MKLERLVSIIYKLLNHEVLSASTLAEEYQVSPRTIYRDIDVICAAGFPVVSHQGMNGGYGIMDGYKMDKSLLGSYDVNSLITVLTSLSTVFDDARAQGTIERLQTIGEEHHRPSLTVDLDTRRAEPDALPHLRTGIINYQVVQFDYINAKNERTTREMEPVRLQFKYRSWYVYGFCRSRQDYREFRLSRMMNVRLTNIHFDPRSVQYPEIALPSSISQDDMTDVIFLVKPETLAEAIDYFPQAHKQFHEDGSMTMSIQVNTPLKARWLYAYLLSFGSGAEILEPIELRDAIKQQLGDALRLYDES
ncbi:helix-turn-helix transcriptional regulator [Paenibacillus sp. TSA_86.1]|uniref:helix-turn-helix transcriptional regulator n=1 Tax=Paenibacillus sp. TSA_86.1 TaxID=3415649 RepID=UPI004046078F